MQPPAQLAAILSAVLVGLAAFAWLVLRARRRLARRRIIRRLRRAGAGQTLARGYLERQGFEVLAAEQTATAAIVVDGRARPYDVRIDYVVRRHGRLYGVEVKTGEQAVDPLHAPTRRQLLEYSRVFSFDGLYLLDMTAPRLMRVAFSDGAGATRPRAAALLLALAVGLALGALALWCLQRPWCLQGRRPPRGEAADLPAVQKPVDLWGRPH